MTKAVSDVPYIGPHGVGLAKGEEVVDELIYPLDRLIQGGVLRVRFAKRESEDTVRLLLTALPADHPHNPERQWSQGYQEGVRRGMETMGRRAIETAEFELDQLSDKAALEYAFVRLYDLEQRLATLTGQQARSIHELEEQSARLRIEFAARRDWVNARLGDLVGDGRPLEEYHEVDEEES